MFLILSPEKQKKKAFFKFSLINRMLDHSEITGASCQEVIPGNLIENIAVHLKNVRFAEGFLNSLSVFLFYNSVYNVVINFSTTKKFVLTTVCLIILQKMI